MPSRPAPRILTVLAAAALALVALTACATPHSLDGAKVSGVPTPTATSTAGSPGENALVVRDADHEVHLETVTMDQNSSELPDAAAEFTGDALYVFVRPAGWTLDADQYSGTGADMCSRWHTATQVDDLGGGWWRVRPGGPAGDFDVHLTAGSGPGLPLGGTVGASEAVVGWRTTTSGPEVPVLGDAAIGGDDGRTVFVSMRGVPQGWSAASAEVMIEGSTAQPLDMTLPLNRPECAGSDTPWFERDLTDAELEALGDEPLTFDATVTVGETVYRAQGTTDADGSAALTFTR